MLNSAYEKVHLLNKEDGFFSSPSKNHVRKPYTIVEFTSNPCKNTNTLNVKKVNMNLKGEK